MSTKFIQPGDHLTFTNGSGGTLDSGQPYLQGVMFGVVQNESLTTEIYTMKTEGVNLIAKDAAQAWTEGQRLYWDDTLKVLSTTATSGFFPVGIAAKAALAADTEGEIRLDGVGLVVLP